MSFTANHRVSFLAGWLAAAGAVAATGAAYLGAWAVFGLREPPPGGLQWLSTCGVLLLVIGFTAGVGKLESRSNVREIGELMDLLHGGESAAQTIERRMRLTRGMTRRVAALLGVILGTAVALGGDGTRSLPDPPVVAVLTLTGILFAMLGVRVLESIVLSAMLSTLGREHATVDLFDPVPLRGFARPGLRLAVNWFLGSALASLLFFQSTTPGIVAVIILFTLAIGAASLLLPARGIRARVREVKTEEVARIRAALREERTALLEGTEPEAGSRVPALIALEARVQAVHEWPFDASTLLRFAAVAILATGSWIGGALVERVIAGLLEQ